MGLLHGSVGAGGKNLPADVRLVETLLNKVWLAKPEPDPSGWGVILRPRIRADERVETETIRAIKGFQKRFVGMQRPDGRVDPGRRTIRKLAQMWVEMGRPLAVSLRDVAPLDPGRVWRTYNLAVGTIEAGAIYFGPYGRRLVLAVKLPHIVYLQLDLHENEVTHANPLGARAGQTYKQRARDFYWDVYGGLFGEVARRVAPVARLARLEVELMIGIVGSTPLGFVAVGSMSLLQFVVQHKDEFGTWARVAVACYAARSTLKSVAPTLWDKVIDALLILSAGVSADAVRRTPGHVTPESGARIIGGLVGAVGISAAKGRLGALTIALEIVKAAAKGVARAAPGALAELSGDYRRLAEELIATLGRVGVTLTRSDVVKIFEEVQKSPDQIQNAIDDVLDAAAAL